MARIFVLLLFLLCSIFGQNWPPREFIVQEINTNFSKNYNMYHMHDSFYNFEWVVVSLKQAPPDTCNYKKFDLGDTLSIELKPFLNPLPVDLTFEIRSQDEVVFQISDKVIWRDGTLYGVFYYSPQIIGGYWSKQQIE
jgi:hypothetical protein